MQINAEIKKIFHNKNDFLAGLIKPDNAIGIPAGARGSSSGGLYRFNGKHLLGSGNLEHTRVQLDGEWTNGKYGWGFDCKLINIEASGDLYFFLVSFITGVGPKLASQLIRDFGNDNLIDMIENRPHELTAIKGIGPKIRRRIVDSWTKFSAIRKVSAILLPAGASPNLVHKVCKHFENHDDLIGAIEKNIFILLEVQGVGFRLCDGIALKSGMAKDDPRRIEAAIIYCLQSIGTFYGHTVCTIDDLFAFFKDQLEINLPPATWYISLNKLVSIKKVVILKQHYVCLANFYKAEGFIANFIKTRAKLRAPAAIHPENLDAFIGNLERTQGFSYNQQQRNAIIQANDHMFCCISGIAGAGKTTVSKGIIEVLSNLFPEDAFCVTALSGIATDRIRKATGYFGATIQSLIVKYQDEGKLPFKVLIIDEGAMISSMNCYQILKMVPDSCRVIMIGDIAQLDPVGPGSPFTDIIKHAKIDTTNLTEPNRQSKTSAIISVANDIRRGVYPKDLHKKSCDFRMVNKSIPDFFNFRRLATEEQMQRAKDKVVDEVKQEVLNHFAFHKDVINGHLKAGDYHSFLFGHQLITPMKKGPLGTVVFNELIQSCMNSNTPVVPGADGDKMGVHDKVVHISNVDMKFMTLSQFNKNPMGFDHKDDTRVFNGFIGVVLKIDEDDQLLWVYYPADEKVVIYEFREAKFLLQLAHSITIHKSQGSEYDFVILPVHNCFYKMLSARLYYTGVTRARMHCTLVGDAYALKTAVRNNQSADRNTLLQKLFKNTGGIQHV